MASAAALHIADQDIQNCRFCDSAEHKSENFPDICEKNEASPPAASANMDTVISSLIPQAE